MMWFITFPRTKKFVDRRGTEFLSGFSVEKILSLSAENFHKWDTLVFFFGYWKLLVIRDGGGKHVFPMNLFCLTAQKHVIEEPFSAAFHEFSGCQLVYR